ncbi:MAG: hypothetical protein V3T77_08890 [Planctomycetota bacterium]
MAAENSQSQRAGAPKFPKIGTGCGCFVLLGVMLIIAATMIGKYLVGQLPPEPYDFPVAKVDAAKVAALKARIQERVAAGHEVELSADELTVLVQQALQSGSAGPRSKFRCTAAGDGYLRFQLSYEFSEGRLLEGRFYNLDCTVSFTMANGEFREVSMRRYQFGVDEEHEDLPAGTAKAMLEENRDWGRKNAALGEALDRVRDLRIEGDHIIVKLD